MIVRTPIPRETWQEVYHSDPDALPEHSPEWTDGICALGAFSDASRLYETGDGRRFVLPLLRRRGAAGSGGWFASPPPAFGMGGLIGRSLDGDVVAAVIDDLRNLRAVRVAIRPDPLRAEHWKHGSAGDLVTIPRRGHVIDLSGGTDEVEARFAKSTRRNLRRAGREGVEVEVDRHGRLLDVHDELFELSLRRWALRQNEPLRLARWRGRRRDPIHKLRTLSRHLDGRFCQFVARHDGRAVASIIVLVDSTAHYTRGVMDAERAGPVRANELLQATAIRHAVDAGCRSYHMGESGESASLARFKEKFGATPHDHAEIRVERLPVTRSDRMARNAVKTAIGFRDA